MNVSCIRLTVGWRSRVVFGGSIATRVVFIIHVGYQEQDAPVMGEIGSAFLCTFSTVRSEALSLLLSSCQIHFTVVCAKGVTYPPRPNPSDAPGGRRKGQYTEYE